MRKESSTLTRDLCHTRQDRSRGKIKETKTLPFINSHSGGDPMSKMDQNDSISEDKDASKGEKREEAVIFESSSI